MKTIKSLLTIALFCMAITVHATVYTVDNHASAPTPYQTIQSAVDVASNGDTIYVQGSGFPYATFTLNKQLVIIGAGANPQKQNAQASIVTKIILDAAASGSSIMGFQIPQKITYVTNNVDNISFIGNYCDGTGQTSCHVRGNNWIVRNNFFVRGIQIDTATTAFTCENNVFTIKGIISDNLNPATALSTGAVVIKNNIFLDNSFGGAAFENGGGGGRPTGLTVENNIFFGQDPSLCSGCTFNNNISYLCNNATLPPSSCSGINNVSATDPLFINFPLTGANYFYGTDCHLQTTSAGHNTGTDGTDRGIYGSASPFIYGGEPAIPQIKSLDIHNTVVPVGGSLQFNAVSKK